MAKAIRTTRGPGRPAKKDGKHEMHKTNPKADLKEAGENLKDAAKKTGAIAKDALKEAADASKGFWAKTVEFVKKIPSACIEGVKSLFNGIIDILNNIWETTKGFFKGLFDREKLNSGSAIVKLVAGVLGMICFLFVAADFVLMYVTVQQLLMITAGVSAGAYAVHRLTMDKPARENTRVSINEMFVPYPSILSDSPSKAA